MATKFSSSDDLDISSSETVVNTIDLLKKK
jgi:hypothetical protein